MKNTDAIQAAFDPAVLDGVFPGGVLAVRVYGQLQLLVTAGRLSAEPAAERVRNSTIYDLASLTKPLATATSILLLVQAGKVELDAAIGRVRVELKDAPI